MSSFRSLQFQRQWRVQRALSMWLLVCFLSCVNVQGDPAADESTIHSYLRSAERQDRELNIFDRDGRQQVTDPSAYPYSTVGLLRWDDDATCTATLVASNIVLTAADCVLTSDGELRGNTMGSAVFSLPQTSGTQRSSIARVHKQSDFWTKWTRNTYVLVELADDLGTTNGVLHLPGANTFAQDAPMNVQLVGYGQNGEAGECFQLCKIHFPSEFDGPDCMLHHDCDVSVKRSPGSPMLIRSTNLDTYIVGIHTNAIGDDEVEAQSTKTYPSYNDTVANRGVLGSFVQPHLSFLLQKPASSSSSSSTSSEASTSLEVKHGSESSAPSSSSSYSSAGSMTTSSPDSRDSQADAGVSADLAPSSSSSDTASVAAPKLGIAATAAYSCIGAVCVSWLAIIIVAVRRIRANR